MRATDALNRAEKACWRARDLTGQLLTFSRGGDPVRKTLELSARSSSRPCATRCSTNGAPGFPARLRRCPRSRRTRCSSSRCSTIWRSTPCKRCRVGRHAQGHRAPHEHQQRRPRGRQGRRDEWIEWDHLRDNGSGILPENLSRIFDPFFRPGATARAWGWRLPIRSSRNTRGRSTSIHSRGTARRSRSPCRPRRRSCRPRHRNPPTGRTAWAAAFSSWTTIRTSGNSRGRFSD